MSEYQLDIIIGSWKPRLRKYNELRWSCEEVSVKDVGVWCGARGLPIEWCVGSVVETAQHVKATLKDEGLPGEARRAIEGIMKVAQQIRTEPLLYVIAVPGGTWRKPPCRTLKWDLDDGSMRAAAFTLLGDKKILAYVGRA